MNVKLCLVKYNEKASSYKEDVNNETYAFLFDEGKYGKRCYCYIDHAGFDYEHIITVIEENVVSKDFVIELIKSQKNYDPKNDYRMRKLELAVEA